MPTYCYECESCGPFEVYQKLDAEPLTSHDCGSACRKTLAPVALVMRESEKASYFAGREGDQRMRQQMAQNACVAAGVKRGEYTDPKRGETQSQTMFNDLERRLKDG